MSINKKLLSLILATFLFPFLLSISNISGSAGVICDTANGFSWNGTNCSKTETISKICHPNRNYPAIATNSSQPELDGVNCVVQKVNTQVTQDFALNSDNPRHIDSIEIGGVNYLVAAVSNNINVYQINPSLTTFNTTPVQTFSPQSIPGVATSTFYNNVISFKIGSNNYIAAIRSTTTSGVYRVEVFQHNGTNFVFDHAFNTNSLGFYGMSHFEIEGDSFIGVGSQIHKYNSSSNNWDFQIGGVDGNNSIEGGYSNFGGDHFYFATGYGSGNLPPAFKYNTTTDTWSLFYSFPNPIVPSGFPPRLYIGNFQGQTPGNVTLGGTPIPYPTGYYVGFSVGGHTYQWNGTSFVALPTGNTTGVYSPFYAGRTNPGRYTPNETILFKDYHYFIGGDSVSRICTNFVYNHSTTGSECATYPNGAKVSNIFDSPTDNEVIVSDDQIHVYSTYAHGGKSGIVASTRLSDETYTSFCPAGGYTSDGSTVATCSRIVNQSSGQFYEIEYADFNSVTCTPSAVERSETIDCVINLSYNNYGFPVQLPTGGDILATINTASGTSDACTLTTPTQLTCNNIPATGSNLGNQTINLTFPSQTPENIETANILSTPTISSLSQTQSIILGGDRITINGTDFVNGTTVTIDGNACTDVNFVSSTEINCLIQAGSEGIVNLVVTNPDSQTVTIPFEYIDDDGDSIPKAEEQQGPNGGDGNDDGVQDYLQDNVISLPSNNDKEMTLELGADCTTSSNTYRQLPNSISQVDTDYTLASDLLGYEIPCATGTTEITQYWYGLDTNQDFVFRKYGPTIPGDENSREWYTLESANIEKVTIGGEDVVKVTFELQDGQVGDDTGIDGVITDPGGLAVLLEEETVVTDPDSETESNTQDINNDNILIRTGGY